MEILKNGKIRILIYQKSYPLTWIPIIPHLQVRKGKRGLKILNWTKGRVRLISRAWRIKVMDTHIQYIHTYTHIYTRMAMYNAKKAEKISTGHKTRIGAFRRDN